MLFSVVMCGDAHHDAASKHDTRPTTTDLPLRQLPPVVAEPRRGTGYAHKPREHAHSNRTELLTALHAEFGSSSGVPVVQLESIQLYYLKRVYFLKLL